MMKSQIGKKKFPGIKGFTSITFEQLHLRRLLGVMNEWTKDMKIEKGFTPVVESTQWKNLLATEKDDKILK
jgi:hypothetical protein